LKRLLLFAFITIAAVSAQGQPPSGTPADAVVRFYPNPATSIITFDLQKVYEAGYSLQIYNFPQGKKVHESKNLGPRTTIPVSDYTRGVYIYQLRDRSGRMIESGKFQVSR
jgi:hypothetical protein